MNILVLKAKKQSVVPLIPSDVKHLIKNKNKIFFQKNLGIDIGYNDNEYIANGAKAVKNINKSFIREIDLILMEKFEWKKIFKFLNPNQIILSRMNITNNPNHLLKLLKNNITSLSAENIKDGEKFGYIEVIEKIKGYYSIILSGNLLLKTNKKTIGMSLASLGSETEKANLTIFNYSLMSEYVIKTAISLGTNITLFDKNTNNLKKIENNETFKKICNLTGSSIVCKEAKYEKIKDHLIKTNVLIIGSAQFSNQIKLTKELLEKMPSGSVVIDASLDSSYALEIDININKKNNYYKNVHIFGFNDAINLFPNSASKLISNFNKNILSKLDTNMNVSEILKNDKNLRNALMTYKGNVVNIEVARALKLKYTNFDSIL